MDNPEDKLIYRGIQGEEDYALLWDIYRSSSQADQHEVTETLEDLTKVYAPSPTFNPEKNVIIAVLPGDSDQAIGYSRVGSYTSRADTRLYYQICHIRQEYRRGPFWRWMVEKNEARLREFAGEDSPLENRYFQAWAADYQTAWMSLLIRCGYQIVRRFNNMLFVLDRVPDISIPEGIKIYRGSADTMREIWKAQKEMNAGLFENVAEDWLEEKYPAWLEKTDNKPEDWITAWDGENLVGTLCARYEAETGQSSTPKRGYTEHIYVRPLWRKRGLASALIAQGLHALKMRGAEAAELGVDAENESAAYRLYEKIGYRTDNVDTWLRKPMK